MIYLNPALFNSSDDYESARQGSEELDRELGFEIERVEKQLLTMAQALDPKGNHKTWGQALHEGNQTWVGLSYQTLQTPYSELVKMCQYLSPLSGSTVVDLGAGYGRMGLVLDVFYPGVRFIGYEYVKERVDEGTRILKKFDCEQAKLLEQDLTASDFKLPLAEYYFVYDYGTLAHIRETLKTFEKLADHHKFKLIARGKGIRSLIQYEHPWLASVYPAIHEENFSIYSMSSD
jgi:hypothetical protein